VCWLVLAWARAPSARASVGAVEVAAAFVGTWAALDCCIAYIDLADYAAAGCGSAMPHMRTVSVPSWVPACASLWAHRVGWGRCEAR
jgi:hypothetical protein